MKLKKSIESNRRFKKTTTNKQTKLSKYPQPKKTKFIGKQISKRAPKIKSTQLHRICGDISSIGCAQYLVCIRQPFDNMEEVWMSACKKFQVPEPVATGWFNKIRTRLSSAETGRFFHNWNEVVESKVQYLQDANEFVVFAVCFQYFDFDVKKSCVEENCKAFRDFCTEAGYSDENNMKRVERILGNESVETYDQYEEDVQVIQDLDLVVLGLSTEHYKNYTQLLRKEYFHLNDVSYKSMRLKILQTFLTIPAIYATDSFRDKYEEAARSNIKSEIEELKK